MQINLSYDSSVEDAPPGFVSAMQYAAQELDADLPAAVTVTIDVGWGEVGGAPVTGNDLGEAAPSDSTYVVSYQQLKGLMWANGVTPADYQAISGLPTGDPTNGGNIELFPSEEKLFGLLPANSSESDGEVGFGANNPWDFDPNNRGAAGTYDFIGTAEHELSHALGRYSDPVQNAGIYSMLDMFRYDAPYQHQPLADQPNYFSLNSGVSNLASFDTTSDASDWALGTPADSFDAYAAPSVANLIGSTDLGEMDALGLDSSLTRQAFDGSAGGQTFVFTHQPEVATVSNFVLAGQRHDTIQLPASHFSSLAEVLAHTESIGGTAGGGPQASVIHLGPHDTIVLPNVSPAELKAHSADFKFA